MRDEAQRPQIDTLFVLGAGSSYAATYAKNRSTSVAPLDKNFCERIRTLDYRRPKWVAEAVHLVRSRWKDAAPFESFGLEAAIIRQVSHLEFFDSIQPRRRGSCTSEEYLDTLVHLICFVLHLAKEVDASPYQKLASHAYPAGRPAEGYRNRIVTFNYDTLLDRYLLDRFSIERVYFDRLKRTPDQGDRRHERHSDPLLIKLHGSTNWHCRTNEFKHIVGSVAEESAPYFIDPIWHDDSSRLAPSDDASPCIIPPLPLKPITSLSLFHHLWTRAYEYLHTAKRIVICGYSLPPADTLAVSMFGNFENQDLESVVVVDPNPGILRNWQELFRRPKVRWPRWEYFSDFREYCDAL